MSAQGDAKKAGVSRARQEALWDLAARIRAVLERHMLTPDVVTVLEDALALVEAQTK